MAHQLNARTGIHTGAELRGLGAAPRAPPSLARAARCVRCYSDPRARTQWYGAYTEEHYRAQRQSEERERWAASVRSITDSRGQESWGASPLDPPALLSGVAVVIISPRKPVTVGTVARACGSFECEDLRIVMPRQQSYITRHAKSASKGAQYILYGARQYDSIEQATADCQVRVAFTRWSQASSPHVSRVDIGGLTAHPAVRSVIEQPLLRAAPPPPPPPSAPWTAAAAAAAEAAEARLAAEAGASATQDTDDDGPEDGPGAGPAAARAAAPAASTSQPHSQAAHAGQPPPHHQPQTHAPTASGSQHAAAAGGAPSTACTSPATPSASPSPAAGAAGTAGGTAAAAAAAAAAGPAALPFPRVALVFGREELGMADAEVDECEVVCSVPMGRLQESLSLSHAVSIALCSIYQARLQHLSAAAAEGGGGGGSGVDGEGAPAALARGAPVEGGKA